MSNQERKKKKTVGDRKEKKRKMNSRKREMSFGEEKKIKKNCQGTKLEEWFKGNLITDVRIMKEKA